MKAPSTIGIALTNGFNLKLVDKNSNLPIEKKSTVSTFEDNQTSVLIQIVYGDNVFAGDNIKVAEYILDNIPPKPKATPKIEICFRVNTELILRVKTTVLDNGYTKEFEDIDLSKVTPPEANNPSATALFSTLFEEADLFKTWQPASESDDFTKIIFKLSSDEKFRLLYFKSKQQALNGYNLENEQSMLLQEIITPDILSFIGTRSLINLMTNSANILKSNPNAVRCSHCKGLGWIVKIKNFLGLKSGTPQACNNCNGVGYIK